MTRSRSTVRSRRRPDLLLTRGLRGRLVIAFILVAMLGAAAAGLAGMQQAARSLSESSQQQHATTLEDRVTAIAPSVEYPPSEEALEQLRLAVGEDTLVRYEGLQVASGVFTAAELDPSSELIAAVEAPLAGDGHSFTQRVRLGDTPWLVVGAPVMVTAPSGARTPSGVHVYTAHSLAEVQEQIDSLALAAAVTSAAVLPVAVVLALMASGTVLRPVQRLRTTARRLADGDLSARTDPRGVDELAQLTSTVNDMAESLQDSMVTMAKMQDDAKRFAADVSHELRTPLTTLTAAVEVLHDAFENHLPGQEPHSEAEADARESAQLAIQETRRLVQLVEDIMEIARFDSGSAALQLQSTAVTTLVKDCVRARGWSQEVTIDTAELGGGDTVTADRRRLDVALANLIGNALKHGAAPVQVNVIGTADAVVVEITDSGPGLPGDALPHIFDRFRKADASRSRTVGSGLGLAIARENARIHGGDITAENVVDGARFTLWLQRHGPDEPNPDPGRRPENRQEGDL